MPVFELKLKGSLCRVERDNGLPLLDCYLPKGTTFVVRDRFNQKERSGVLSWGQFHLRQQKETFLMFRSEDGRFKRTRESLKLFFSGQNTKREIARWTLFTTLITAAFINRFMNGSIDKMIHD